MRRAPPVGRAGACWVLAWVGALFGGCSSPDIRAEDSPYFVDEVSLSGVTVFERDELLAYLHVGETSAWPWGTTYYYSEALARIDAQRLSDVYAARGYYDAQVRRFAVSPIDPDDDARGPRPARVDIEIDEGPPTLLREVEYRWTGPRDPALAEAVEGAGRSRQDAPFSVDDFNKALVDYKLALQERGFALAKVEHTAWVTRAEHRAKVEVRLDPGPYCRIGVVEFVDLGGLPADLIGREIEGLSGKPYSPSRLKRAEGALFSLDVFRAVTAVPAPTVDEDGRLDVRIHTASAPPQSLKIGFGFGFEPTRWEERITFLYTHRNLFGRLYRLDLKARVGWAELPYPWNVSTHGPVLDLAPAFRKKGLLEQRLVWTLAPRFELGIEQGFQFYSPSGRVGVSRWLFGRTLAELNYRLTFFDFFNLESEFSANKTQLGLDFRDPYLLSLVEASYSIFFTDDLLEPRNGLVLALKYAVAGGGLRGDFDFQRVIPEARAYWTFTRSTQIVARARVGTILTYGDRPGAPIAEKFALGGADTIRGWGLRRLSPQIRDCPDGDCRGIPVGGDRMVLGNLELRQEIIQDLYLATFLDGGDVTESHFNFDAAAWHYSTGLGARYATPIGRFRVDFGYRVTAPSGYPGEPRWAFHLALGESF